MQWLLFFCLGTLLCVDQLSAANACYTFIHFPPFSPSSFSRSSFFGISLLRERSPETQDEYVFYSTALILPTEPFQTREHKHPKVKARTVPTAFKFIVFPHSPPKCAKALVQKGSVPSAWPQVDQQSQPARNLPHSLHISAITGFRIAPPQG